MKEMRIQTLEPRGLAGLVGELERLADSLWGADESEAARRGWTRDLCNLVALAGAASDAAAREAEVGHRAALEAYWADKARDFAKAAPEGEGAVRAVDENMAISLAAAKLLAEHRDFLDALDFLAQEFIRLALEFCKATASGGEVAFESGDLAAAKKRADALKRLAEAVDAFGDAKDVEKVHAAIIAYSNACGNERA